MRPRGPLQARPVMVGGAWPRGAAAAELRASVGRTTSCHVSGLASRRVESLASATKFRAEPSRRVESLVVLIGPWGDRT